MKLALGIDTGGTYTDAVVVDQDTGGVLAAAKALTTRQNLAMGIGQALLQVFSAASRTIAGFKPEAVELVALSTTLATNALAEGQGGVVSLILIGYDPELIRQFGFHRDLATDDVVYIRGGHDASGDQVAPLDEDAARAAILTRRYKVEAFAVSGYFGVRNPAHELRVRAMVQDLTGLPVTCGHELTTQLNAIQRATTVALNAHLILPLRELICSVQQTMDHLSIRAPLMVVKGDGSLVRADWAMQRPIETILSGPAASVVGAWHLAGCRDMWAVDVGGTTTDIAALHDGRPVLNPAGARVGGWKTMVEAVDVHTAGLGGDSHVQVDHAGNMRIGPRRAVPLSLLACQHPEIMEDLQHYLAERRNVSEGTRPPERNGVTEFVMPLRTPPVELSAEDRSLLETLSGGPQSLATLVGRLRNEVYLKQRLESLEVRRLIQRAGFTPTDALHVLGRYQAWNVEAARLGAEWLAARLEVSVEAFCEQVVHRMSDRVTTELVSKVLEDEVGQPRWEAEPSATALLNRALDGSSRHELDCRLSLRHPLVAIGAPVRAYMPRVAEQLHTELAIPPHADVANAVGAVAGGVVQRIRVLISQQERVPPIRLHLPDGVRDFADIEQAVRYAQQVISQLAEDMARRAGAEAAQIETKMERHDHQAITSRGEAVYLGTELLFTAAGRPSQARRES